METTETAKTEETGAETETAKTEESNSPESSESQEDNAESDAEKTAETGKSEEDQEEAGDDAEKDQESDEEESKKEFDLELPEDSIIKDKAEFVSILKGATESQEGFEKLGKFIENLSEGVKADQVKADKVAWDNTVTKWKNELKQDETFGIDYKGNVELANKTAKSIGLDGWLKETGFDKNPAVLRAMAKVGQERADASVHTGDQGEGGHAKNRDGSTKFTFDKK